MLILYEIPEITIELDNSDKNLFDSSLVDVFEYSEDSKTVVIKTTVLNPTLSINNIYCLKIKHNVIDVKDASFEYSCKNLELIDVKIRSTLESRSQISYFFKKQSV